MSDRPSDTLSQDLNDKSFRKKYNLIMGPETLCGSYLFYKKRVKDLKIERDNLLYVYSKLEDKYARLIDNEVGIRSARYKIQSLEDKVHYYKKQRDNAFEKIKKLEEVINDG